MHTGPLVIQANPATLVDQRPNLSQRASGKMQSALESSGGIAVSPPGRWSAWSQLIAECVRERPELLLFVGLIAVFNAPLITGLCWQSMVFQDAAILQGQWWRVLTHPFVHVTWYHLFLDATAFLTLYAGLLDKSVLRRLSYLIGGAAGSLFVSWATAMTVAQGLCGLSGVAHGLMAVSAVEMISSNPDDESSRRLGWVSLILVIAKAGYEAISGKMFFSFLQFGLLGSPVAVSHAGGIIGGLLVWMATRLFAKTSD
jgi:rhomboid family GlyGly-CTERM serine protease